MTEGRIRAALGDLPNKPLVEAIFELRWATDPVGPNVSRDPAWKLLPGLFYGEMRKEYPVAIDLPATQIPEEIAAYMVRHQFRVGKDQWPLVQLGPGIMSVNETEKYTVWDDFLPRILGALNALSSIYPEDLQPSQAELRFINAVPFDPSELSPTQFLKEQLHTTAETVPRLSDGEADVTNPSKVNLSLTLPLLRPKGEGSLSFALGKKGEKPSIIWQLAIKSRSPDIPSDAKDFNSWLDSAHGIIEQWFLKLTEGQLLESFKGSNL